MRYLKAFRSLAAERGLPWMYWELASGFGVYDPVAHAFRPEIYSALYDLALIARWPVAAAAGRRPPPFVGPTVDSAHASPRVLQRPQCAP